MVRKKSQLEIVSRHGHSAATPPAPPTVSGRWILTALGVVLGAAVVCAWASLCLLFWQGAWQLLYRPASLVKRTPVAAGLGFEQVGFAATETGQPRLRGWWIPAVTNADPAPYTLLYLHGRVGNLGDCVNELAQLHFAGVNVFAFDYRGYGQSEFVHPSEARWRQDTDWALYYLTATRQVPVDKIVLVGSGLGANLALEVAAEHPELAGVVLDSPMNAPLERVFSDARAHLVPAHLLFHGRYRMLKPASGLRIPSLWILGSGALSSASSEQNVIAAFSAVIAPKMMLRDTGSGNSTMIKNWLQRLRTRAAS
jgi:pimeloyl-ACP methyl ester carboxylesterase